jgi:outer membrane receptor protein involved in Fe transport
LRSLPSTAIDRIEIITNPSARYDASGNSGIIDIRLKKDQRMGTNGNFTIGYGQGVYPKANSGITFNHRKQKLNAFGNYNYVYRKNLNHLFLNRNFLTNGVFTGGDDKDNYTTIPVQGHRARFGMDFFPSAKTIFGFVVNGGRTNFSSRNMNGAVVVDDTKAPVYTFNTAATNKSRNYDFVGNLNFKHTFDSTGREITADVDFGSFGSTSFSRTATNYYNLDGTTASSPYILDGDQKGKLTLRTAKADYVQNIGKTRLEAGFKTSFVSADNNAVFTDMSGSTPVNDAGKTNHFLYDENNNAGYLSLRREFKKWSWQAGLRAEQTNISTYQEIGKVDWDSSYLQAFPSLYLNYKLTPNQTLGFSVSRRIDRPNYGQLNPFLFLIDVTTYTTGNPGLLPQFTWAYEVSYNRKQLTFNLGYSRTKYPLNTILTRFRDQFPNLPSAENVTVQIPINLESSEYFGLTVSAPFRVKPWWNMTNNLNFYYNHFKGSLSGSVLSDGKPVADIRTNHNFTLKKGWGAEAGLNYNSGGRSGYMVFKSQWGLAVGVQKTIMKGAGTLRLNANDIFWTNLPRATVNIPGRYIENWHAIRESRTVNLTFTYSFGNKKVQAARRRTTGSEEEVRRI